MPVQRCSAHRRRSAAAARALCSAASRACSRSAGTCRPPADRGDRPCRAARSCADPAAVANREVAVAARARAAARRRRSGRSASMRKHRLAEPGGGRRAQQPRPLEARLGVGQIARARDRRPSRTVARAASRFAGVIAPMPGVLPRVEERLEHLVDELPLPPRIHHLFVVGLFLEPQHVLREKLERAVRDRFRAR